MKRGILIHGGAGSIKKSAWDSRARGLKEAVVSGFKKLISSDDSLEAVIQAVSVMEDSGLFNAGKGSVITFGGKVELDAAVADWRGHYGAVGGVPNIQNPVRLAKEIMNRTQHHLLVGEAAKKFGLELGFKEYSIEELTGFSKFKEYLNLVKNEKSYYKKLYETNRSISSDTVGAVAINSLGEVAAAVSTGGLLFKLDGRVGDSAIHGAGIMADSLSASVATGIGEYIIDSMLTYLVVRYRHYMSLKAACRKAINFITRYRGDNSAGLICIDRYGYMGWVHNTEAMGRAYIYEGISSPIIEMSGDSFIRIA